MSVFFARHALLPDGWAENVRFVIDSSGNLATITAHSSPEGATHLPGIVLPGMPNAHSHAFQRTIAGDTETASGNGDSFWTWREAMYASIATLGPDAFEKVTTDTFVAMVRAGYSHVCEFHYVHNAPDGSPYDDPNELAHRVVAAARTAGIGLTLLPVLYRYADFGGVPAQPHQRRFLRTIDAYADAWLALRRTYGARDDVVVGMAPHSLRAVTPDDLRALSDLAASDGGASVPMHIHVSEQRGEVDACRAYYGTTPIALLANTVALDERWCLVHATHATPQERETIVRSGAVVALCPTTEANLGDGVFPAAEFVRAGGPIALGSDSNVSIDVAEELRWLEYVQRLVLRERNVMCDAATPSVARFLYARAAAGGAAVSGAPIGRLQPGTRADFVALETLEAEDPDATLGRAIFAGGAWRIGASVCAGSLQDLAQEAVIKPKSSPKNCL